MARHVLLFSGMQKALPKLLYVDDDELLQRVIPRLVRGAWTPFVAGGIEKALALAANHRFEVVVSDYMLADGTGIDLFKQLRPILPSARFVLVSGHPGADRVALAHPIVSHFLAKPWDNRVLLDLLSSLKDP